MLTSSFQRYVLHWRLTKTKTHTATLFAKPTSLNINIGSDRFATFNKKRDIPVPTATADQQHYDDDDQKSSAVHIVLLLGDKRGWRSGYSQKSKRTTLKIKTGHCPSRGASVILSRSAEFDGQIRRRGGW